MHRLQVHRVQLSVQKLPQVPAPAQKARRIRPRQIPLDHGSVRGAPQQDRNVASLEETGARSKSTVVIPSSSEIRGGGVSACPAKLISRILEPSVARMRTA